MSKSEKQQRKADEQYAQERQAARVQAMTTLPPDPEDASER